MSSAPARPGRGPAAPRPAWEATDDEALVERVLGGDRSAYAGLVGRHQERLYRQARAMGLDADTCEDLVQEAFVTAYEKLVECHDPARFGVWVYRILRNRCLDHLKDVRRRSVPIDEVVLHARHGLPERDAALARARQQIEAGLRSLSPLLREAFLMKHHLGMDYAEMAEIQGVGVSAVKMRVQRSREALRQALAPLDLEDGV